VRRLIGFGLIGRIINDHKILEIIGKRPALIACPFIRTVPMRIG